MEACAVTPRTCLYNYYKLYTKQQLRTHMHIRPNYCISHHGHLTMLTA
jgi:hypothetical protein